jgi:hypothetical protein
MQTNHLATLDDTCKEEQAADDDVGPHDAARWLSWSRVQKSAPFITSPEALRLPTDVSRWSAKRKKAWTRWQFCRRTFRLRVLILDRIRTFQLNLIPRLFCHQNLPNLLTHKQKHGLGQCGFLFYVRSRAVFAETNIDGCLTHLLSKWNVSRRSNV